MSARELPSYRALFRGLLIGTLACTVVGIGAVAQPGAGGGMSPEDRAKAESAQAKAVAADLKLDAEKTEKLAAAYTAAKKRAAESRPEASRENWEALLKHQDEQQALLTEDLKSFLDEAQAKQASAVLGGFNRQWDRFVLVILGFGLDEAKQAEALQHTVTYVKASAKARQDNSGAQNMEAIRDAMMAAKKSLDESLAPLLSDAQKTEWTEKTSRMGGRGGGGDRGRRGEDAGRGGAGAPGGQN